MSYSECQFDALVGMTHNYAGLAYGNVASAKHQNQVSNPRAAALQGLEKMRQVAAWGLPQAVLPPILRPNLAGLRALGFHGSDADVVQQAAQESPVLLAAAYSASSMWAANAATVSPSCDTRDGKLHLTPANLASSLHRSWEVDQTAAHLKQIFADPHHFVVHPPLASNLALSDEGAANHIRLMADWNAPGLEVFVFGRDPLRPDAPSPSRYPARQTLTASQAVARRHGLSPEFTLFVQQDPTAIDAGVFHNDVICVGHLDVLLCHERAFLPQPETLGRIQNVFEKVAGRRLHVIEVPTARLSVEDAVSSYLFNSQILSLPSGEMRLVCPLECQEIPAAQQTIDWIVNEPNPIAGVAYFDLRQSMRNGGGPACLRLRVLLNEPERRAVRGRVWLDAALYDELSAWVERHYPERLSTDDLAAPELIAACTQAHEELARIMDLPLTRH